MKICPYCGEKIKSGAKKCRHCGEWLTDNNEKAVTNSVFNNHNDSQKNNIILYFSCGVVVLIISLIAYAISCITAVPKCDSAFAEQQVIEIFKQNNYVLKIYEKFDIPEKYRAVVSFSNPEPIYYDANIKKYSCSATITLSPQNNESKFISGASDGGNYKGSYLHGVNGLINATFRDTMSFNVGYDIYKSNDKNEIKVYNIDSVSNRGSGTNEWFALTDEAQKTFAMIQEEFKDEEIRKKIREAISSYQGVANVYMVENDGNNAYGIVGYNCSNLKNYFKISSQDSACSFTSPNGIYWKFNSDGSAIISDRKVNPKYNVKVGVCFYRNNNVLNNWVVNCPEKYPEAYNL